MFAAFWGLRILVIPLAFLFIGMIFLSADALYLIAGALTALVGLTMVFFQPLSGLILLLIGGVMIAVSVKLRKRAEAEAEIVAQSAQEDARRRSRLDLYLPSDD